MSTQSNQSLDASWADKINAVSSIITPANSLKCTSKRTEAEPIGMRSNIYTTGKRPRLSPVSATSSTHMSIDSGHLSLLMPPETPPVPAVGTMQLKLETPQKDISNEQDQKLKSRQAAAEGGEPKRKRPLPRQRAMKTVHNMKPMRHHTTDETTPLSELPVIKPVINRSARIANLLQSLPVVSEATRNADGTKILGRKAQTQHDEAQNELLKANKRITQSEHARSLAWHAFSSNKRDRVERWLKEITVLGLEWEDLANEKLGVSNDLPEWKKTKTGRLAKSG